MNTRINTLDDQTLNYETSFIFRKGMSLRQWIVNIIFNEFTRPEIYPDIITYGKYKQIIKNPNYKVSKTPYNAMAFKMGCRKLYDIYIEDDSRVLKMNEIKSLSDSEIRVAFLSGYGKMDSRGFYFDRTVEARKEIME